MYYETLSLNADGSYLFTFHFDIGSDEENGTWTVRDSMLHLSPKKRGKVVTAWPSQFFILSVAHDLALSVVEVATAALPEDSPMRLFLPEKKQANQSPEPTPGSVTPAASASAAPPPSAAQL